MAATIAGVADTGAGVSDGEAQRPPDSEPGWLETVGGCEYRVTYWWLGGEQWVGRWLAPDGTRVVTYGLTLDMCRRRLQLEIAARTGVGA